MMAARSFRTFWTYGCRIATTGTSMSSRNFRWAVANPSAAINSRRFTGGILVQKTGLPPGENEGSPKGLWGLLLRQLRPHRSGAGPGEVDHKLIFRIEL